MGRETSDLSVWEQAQGLIPESKNKPYMCPLCTEYKRPGWFSSIREKVESLEHASCCAELVDTDTETETEEETETEVGREQPAIPKQHQREVHPTELAQHPVELVSYPRLVVIIRSCNVNNTLDVQEAIEPKVTQANAEMPTNPTTATHGEEAEPHQANSTMNPPEITTTPAPSTAHNEIPRPPHRRQN
ncbi:hypothetical protein Pelo_5639 [Pelomyxa schiedti]|nr:hypothetical protein Pelo_5639 [Pelomyxa schiedti]